jgi:hypothetical protein
MQIRQRSVGTCVLVALLGATTAAGAGSVVDTFEGSQNIGGWAFFPGDEFALQGGNPGAFLSAPALDVPIPVARTTVASAFTGNYRANRVTSIGGDLLTTYVQWGAEPLPVALLLRSDNGTPADNLDDWGAYCLGPDLPLPGEGWIHYSFAVPYDSLDLPPAWAFVAFGPSAPPDPQWDDLITDVAQLWFCFGDPTFSYVFQLWSVGLDNARIEFEGTVGVDEGAESSSWSAVKALYR